MGTGVDVLVTNISQLLTMGPASVTGPKRGRAMRDIGLVENAALAFGSGKVVAAGPAQEVFAAVGFDTEVVPRVSPPCGQGSTGGPTVIDAGGRVVAPGFVDPHTHLVFAGWRASEYGMRCEGRSYLEIAAAGGGIQSTTSATRAASADHLYVRAMGFLDDMLSNGTTSVEAKSGYGLDPETELKQLRVAARCNEVHAVEVISTFMGAHSVPSEFSSDREGYLRQVIEMLPAVKGLDLARFVDVFCDKGAFTVEESRRVLEAARDLGFGMKIHADELAWTGATELACELGAASCEHLIKVSEAGIKALSECDTVAVLLPATSVYLGECPGAPGRALIDAGAAVSLGTDFNPGTSTAMSMSLIMTLACSTLRLTPEEAFSAATWNAACACGLSGRAGRLVPGYQADAVIFDTGDFREVAYRFGTSLVHTVIKAGRAVVSNNARVVID